MKIAHLFTHFYDGGAEEYALNLAIESLRDGNEIVFIFDKVSPAAKARLEKLSIKYFNLLMPSSYNPSALGKGVSGLNEIIDNEQIDIVHTHMLREHWIAALLKRKTATFGLVRTFHRFDQFNLRMKPILGIINKYTNATIALNNDMKNYLIKKGIKGKIAVIANGVQAIDVKQHEKAIGFLGRISKEKGILDFVKANLGDLKQTKMVIAGEGEDLEAIKMLTAENQLNIEFMGHVQDKQKFFEKISALVLPSKSEVMPLSVLEAYSAGIPVAAFNVDSLAEIINEKTGTLIEFGKYNELFEAAKMLSLNQDKYEKDLCEKHKEEYSATKMFRETKKVYESILK